GHGLFVLLVSLSWYTGKNGLLTEHRVFGYAILTLVLFRIYWGFGGSSTARFAQFVRGPRSVLRYVRAFCRHEEPPTCLGHNPLGAWNVIALLFLLLLQCTLGLFAVDVDGLGSGPLAAYVRFETGRQVARVHE